MFNNLHSVNSTLMSIQKTMSPVQVAEKYMACFYGDAPLESMEALLADDLIFRGPLYEFSSAKDYLESLRADPPIGAKYQMIKVYEGDNSVCLIYLFSKQGIETLMAQTFEINDGKISKINLIFDTKAFK